MRNKVRISIDKTVLLYALEKAAAVVAAGKSQLPMYNSIKLSTEDGALVAIGSNEVNLIVVRAPADIEAGDFPDVLVPVAVMSLIALLRGDAVTLSRDGNRILVSDGLESFTRSAVFDDSVFEDNSVAYRPSDYRQVPSVGTDVPNKMDSRLWRLIVSRANAVDEDEGRLQSSGLMLRVDGGELAAIAISGAAILVWGVPPSLGYVAPCNMNALVPRSSLAAAQVDGGNEIEFGLLPGGRTFFVRDVTGIVEFYCPTISNPFPDISGLLAIPTPSTIVVAAGDVTRLCQVANHYQLTVGEGRSQVKTGRVRLRSQDGVLRFSTASQDGGHDGGEVSATTSNDVDVTMANRLLAVAPRIFGSGSRIKMGIAPNKVQMVADPSDGAIYIMAPMIPEWDK